MVRVHVGEEDVGYVHGRYAEPIERAVAAMEPLGIAPILDLCHFGVPDWIGDFQNPDFPRYFAEYAGELAAFTANPQLFRASRYFDAHKQVMSRSRVYIVADDPPLEIRSDLTDVDTAGNPLEAAEANKPEQ